MPDSSLPRLFLTGSISRLAGSVLSLVTAQAVLAAAVNAIEPTDRYIADPEPLFKCVTTTTATSCFSAMSESGDSTARTSAFLWLSVPPR